MIISILVLPAGIVPFALTRTDSQSPCDTFMVHFRW